MKSLRFALFILIALVFTLPVIAQNDTPEVPEDAYLFEVTGVIVIDNNGDITIDGLIIAPAGAFNPSQLDELEEGQEVTITGYLLNDDTLQAVTFELTDENDDGDTNDDCNVDSMEDDDDTTDNDDIEDADDTNDCDDEDTTDDCDVTDTDDNVDDTTEGDDIEDADDTNDCDDEDTTDDCDVTDTDDTTDDSDDTNADNCDDDENQHPVGGALSQAFDIEYDTILEWRETGLGYGEITRAILIAEQFDDVEVEDVLAQLEALGSWGAVMQAYDVNPSDLAPGQAISNRPENAGNGNGNNGNNGNGNNGNNGNGNGNGNGNNGNGNNGNGNNGNGNNGNGNNGNGNNGNGRNNG